jgi:hypothetical protein
MSLPRRWLTPYIYINRQSGTSRHKLSTRVSGKSQRQIIIQSHQFTIGLDRTSLENTHIPLLWQLCTKHELCVCTWGWLSVAHPALGSECAQCPVDAERQRWWDLPQLPQLHSPISTAANCVGCCSSRRRSIDPHLSSPLLSPPLPSRCYCKAFLQRVMPPDMATYWPNWWGWILDHNSLCIKFEFQQFT